MEILKDILIQDVFLYLRKHDVLIISDIHIGYEQSLHKQGILVPIKAHNELMIITERSINKLISQGLRIKEIMINGDILHNFNKITRDEKQLLNSYMTMLKSYAPISIIRGNHDKTLSYIIPDIEIFTEKIIDNILITHGDIINKHSKDKDIKTIIIGHEHPAVAISKGVRTEKYKCYLKGKHNKKNLIVMPSSNMLIEGTDILKEKLLSPYLRNINDFEVFLIEDKVYDFGTVKQLNKKLNQ